MYVLRTTMSNITDIKKGAFHKWLGKPEDEKITQSDIDKALKYSGPDADHVHKMANFARNAKKWNKEDEDIAMAADLDDTGFDDLPLTEENKGYYLVDDSNGMVLIGPFNKKAEAESARALFGDGKVMKGSSTNAGEFVPVKESWSDDSRIIGARDWKSAVVSAANGNEIAYKRDGEDVEAMVNGKVIGRFYNSKGYGDIFTESKKMNKKNFIESSVAEPFVIFTDDAGFILRTDKYRHFYEDPEHLAQDISVLLDGDTTDWWDGNEIKYTSYEEDAKGAREYSHDDILDFMQNGAPENGDAGMRILIRELKGIAKTESKKMNRFLLREEEITRNKKIIMMGDFMANDGGLLIDRIKTSLKIKGLAGSAYEDPYTALNVFSDEELDDLFEYAKSIGLQDVSVDVDIKEN